MLGWRAPGGGPIPTWSRCASAPWRRWGWRREADLAPLADGCRAARAARRLGAVRRPRRRPGRAPAPARGRELDLDRPLAPVEQLPSDGRGDAARDPGRRGGRTRARDLHAPAAVVAPRAVPARARLTDRPDRAAGAATR